MQIGNYYTLVGYGSMGVWEYGSPCADWQLYGSMEYESMRVCGSNLRAGNVMENHDGGERSYEGGCGGGVWEDLTLA